MLLLLLLFLPLLLAFDSNATVNDESINELVDKNLNGSTTEEPTKVFVTFILRRIDQIDSPRGTVNLEVMLLQEWDVDLDPQQQFNGTEKKTVVGNDVNASMWTPLLQFYSPLETTSSPVHMTISSDGKVKTREGMRMKLPCKHKGHYFPSDELRCDVRIGSLRRANIYVQLSPWFSNMQANYEQELSITPPFQLFVFQSIGVRDWMTYDEGKYVEHQILEIVVRRRGAEIYYWFSSIQPSLFFIILTWISLFLDRKKFIILRIALALVSLVSLQALNFATNTTGRVSEQGNTLDIWFQFASVLIFIVLIENVVICILNERNDAVEQAASTICPSTVDKIARTMDYVIRVFYPIIALIVLGFVVFMMFIYPHFQLRI